MYEIDCMIPLVTAGWRASEAGLVVDSRLLEAPIEGSALLRVTL